eukprot:TRINITY_DN5105_c0_g1_i4.p1 TRINITY_DN5105_c0_g1~~TRINITY_DN5105_c0_g1_i4.p1  ORF type:complete len:247 (-),score=37.99 TRINITY_DN5105_c0_g1_i4:440-1180(-)
MEGKQVISFLGQTQAQQIDKELMENLGFSLDILMELAGLGVAQAIHDANVKHHAGALNRILVLCGPGNNGGDGLVAARHLKMFAYEPTVYLFKKPEKEPFQQLVKTLDANDIPVVVPSSDDQRLEDFSAFFNSNFDLVVDALFGFSFKGPVRSPYDRVLASFKKSTLPIFSVDIPSGWDVEEGNASGLFEPAYLISLTLPKLGVRNFRGRHYLSGRFVPARMAAQYGFTIPKYPGSDQIVDITGLY